MYCLGCLVGVISKFYVGFSCFQVWWELVWIINCTRCTVQTSKYIKITHKHTRFSWPTFAIYLSPSSRFFKFIIRSSNPRQVAAVAIIPEQNILVLAMTSMILTPGHPLTQDQAAHDRCSLTWFPGCRIPRGSASCNNALICFRM